MSDAVSYREASHLQQNNKILFGENIFFYKDLVNNWLFPNFLLFFGWKNDGLL